MLLPCPHCKRRFRLSSERVPAGAAKLRCPACKGYFVLDVSPLKRVVDPVPEPFPPQPSPAAHPAEATQSVPESCRDNPSERPVRRHGVPPALWLWLPASMVLLALIGILAPVVWKTPTSPAYTAARQGPSESYALPSPVSETAHSQAADNKRGEQAVPDRQLPPPTQPPLTYQSLWPFSPTAKEKSCETLAQLEAQGRQAKADEDLGFYAPWIAYLSLETSSIPACDLEPAFGIATQAIEKSRLCGRGYAFLSAYYSYKRVLDRSRSFLEEALQASPNDPWVRLVEAIIDERDLRNSEKAAGVLNDLLRKEPTFALAQYHLAKIYLKGEEYGKAKGLFLLLEKAFPRQPGFMRIRQSLAGIEQVPYYSSQRAKGLLEVSRALSDLTDYPLAGQLCRKVLEDMPETLPNAEKKSAFYDLGRISEITGDKETAFTCYQNALRIDPFYRDARQRIGAILKGDA